MRLFLLTGFLLLFIPSALFSQVPDSLKSKLDGKTVSEQVSYINKLANSKLKSDPSTAYQLAKASLQIAVDAGDKTAELNCLLLTGKASRIAGKSSEAIELINRAIAMLSVFNNTQGLASAYSELAYAYRESGKNNEAIAAFEKSKGYYSQLNDRKNEYSVCNNMGAMLVRTYQYSKAVDVFTRSCELAEAMGDKKEMAYSLSQLGVAQANAGSNAQAMESMQKAKEIATTLNNSTLLANINANIENLNQNIVSKEKIQATYAISNKQNEEYMEKLKSEYMTIKQENLKSLEEIGKLSVENQAKEYRLVALQGQFERQKLETENKEKTLKLLETENNLNKTELQRKQEQISYQRNILFLLIGIAVLLIIFFLWIFRMYMSKKKTLKIVQAQKNEIQKQKEIIQESIEYASHIQKAIIPATELIRHSLPGFFVFLKPRDVVSGDFYWHHREGHKTFIAAVDCTGHGVAGGLMSMIGNSLLNKIIRENKVYEPEKILEELNNDVVETLAQAGDYFDSSMDISLCVIDDSTEEIVISLAGHRCIATVNGEIIDMDGSESAIGGLFPKMNLAYERFTLKKQKGLNIFMFSDGYPDQDGSEGKKLGTNKFIEFLKGLESEDPQKREEKIADHLKVWMGPRKQRDDILVMGFRVE